MRDIREDLKERLRNLEADRDKHHAALKGIEENIAMIMRMLDIEDQQFPKHDDTGDAPSPTKLLSDFIYEELGRRRMAKVEIRTAAEKAGYENAGRAVHLTLVNLQRFQRIRLGPDKKYEWSVERGEPTAPSFFSGMAGTH
jgi:hypothetical protein